MSSLWLKDPARRGMILPRPRVHCTGLVDIYYKLRDDGALHTTPKPRNPTGICDSIEFRISQDPKNKRTQRGTESHTSVVIQGVWLIAKAAFPPGVWVLKSFTTNLTGASRGRAMVRSVIRYNLSPFRDWLNRDYGLITRARGKRAFREFVVIVWSGGCPR